MCGFLAVLIVFNRKNKFKWQHPVISQLFVDHHYVLWGPSVTEKPGLENLLSFDSLLVWVHGSPLKGKKKKRQSTNNPQFCLCKRTGIICCRCLQRWVACDQCIGMWRNWPCGTGLSLGAAALGSSVAAALWGRGVTEHSGVTPAASRLRAGTACSLPLWGHLGERLWGTPLTFFLNKMCCVQEFYA